MKRITLDINIRMIVDVKDNQDVEKILDSITFSEIDTKNDIELITMKVVDGKIIEKK